MNFWKELKDIATYNLSIKMNSSMSDWAELAFKIKSINEYKTIYSSNLNGIIDGEKNINNFNSFIRKLKNDFHLIESIIKQPKNNSVNNLIVGGIDFETGNSNFRQVFVSDNSIIDIYSYGKQEFIFRIQSFNEETISTLNDNINFFLGKKRDRNGRVCTLVVDDSTLCVTDLGPAGIPLVRENYSEEVLQKYDFIVKDLPSANPRGRLVILDGEPGTGKSFMIKSLINDISNVVFLIVPSALVSRISDPSFMPAIINLHEEEQVPIIMLLEDADASLLPRGSDNMFSISDLLNFADGIVGNIIDFRIVATTNAKKIEIEPALLRKGRLSKHIHVGKLEKEQAISIFERITNKKPSDDLINLFDKKITLAEVYDISYEFLENQKTNKFLT